MKRAILRLLKPAALWLNSFQYAAAEDEIQMRQSRKLQLAWQAGEAAYCQRLNTEIYQLRLKQRMLRERRGQIHKW